MASVARELARITQDLEPYLPDRMVREACRAAGHRWRERELGPSRTLHLFVLQILTFNTAVTHLRHLAGVMVGAPAYCRARMRLPLAVFETLLRDSARAMRGAAASAAPGGPDRWCGLRVLLVDGSSTVAPDTDPSREAFGQASGCRPGCGFPVPKVLGLFDAVTGLIIELLAFPLYTHEQSKVCLLHPLLAAGDVLVGDRGFCSFWHAAMLAERQVACVFRMHARQIVDFRPHRRSSRKGERPGRPSSTFLRRLGKWDQVVRWVKPDQRPAWMTRAQYEAMPRTLEVRELRYRIARKGQRTVCVTIATTLLDPVLYPKQKVAELYGVRWSVETHFAELKTTLRMQRVKSKTPAGVRKELAVYCLVYNLVRSAMLDAARRQAVTPDRISFIDAVRWLSSADAGEIVPDLVINPLRPCRHEPRVIKERRRTYKLMTRPRHQPFKPSRTRGISA